MDLGTLNSQQRKAVTASDGPVLVLAGPGSGKTRVLTHRIVWLVEERGVAPWRIMAATFTNKAAREMRRRLEEMLGADAARRLTLGTFHATCARILRTQAEAAGIPRDYTIFDADDQLALVRRILKQLNVDDKRYRPTVVHGAISRAKNELVPPEGYQSHSYFGEIVRRVYALYQEQLRESGALDFDDLLNETVSLLRDHPQVAEQYRERYLHVLVDEFQDTNVAQYVLLRQLTGRHRNLFAVADEDQSIYRWRGADYRNIARLREDHPDLVTCLLEQNYRSTQTILDVAGAVIRRNSGRTEKRLFTERGRGARVIVREMYDQEAEARYVVDTIDELARSGEFGRGDCAVMYRTNAQSRALEEAFIRAGRPYRLVGATRFYARREIKDLIAFLRLIHNPSDSVSLERVVNVPPRAIGQKTVQLLEQAARVERQPLWWAVEAVAEGRKGAPALASRARNAVAAFSARAAGWVAARDESTVLDLLDRVLDETCYQAYLRDGSDEGDERWENVQELRAVAAEYDALADFLTDVALVSDVDGLVEEADAPTLLTLHSAKGLEFPVVFMVGLEEGLLPHSRSLEDAEELAEERRLMYVGVTRAQSRLYLTHAFRRSQYGSYEPGRRSRFLDDVPVELVGGGGPAPARATLWEYRPAPTPAEVRFTTGDRVTHPVFGGGVVIESRPDGADEKVVVAFDAAGLKQIMGGYLTPAE